MLLMRNRLETKKVKVEDEARTQIQRQRKARREKIGTWTACFSSKNLAKKGLWELTEAQKCQNKAVEGSKGFSCEVSVKCKKAGAIAFFVVKWSTAKAKNEESFFGPLKC